MKLGIVRGNVWFVLAITASAVLFLATLSQIYYIYEVPYEGYYPDESFYHYGSERLKVEWRDGGPIIEQLIEISGTKNFLYVLLNYIAYEYLGGKWFLLLVNWLCAVASGWMIFRLLWLTGFKAESIIAFWAYVLFPFVLYWASFDLKDTFLTFLIVASFYFFYIYSRSKRILWLFLFAVDLVLIFFTRFYCVGFVIFSLLPYLKIHRRLLKLVAIILAYVAYWVAHNMSFDSLVEFVTFFFQRSNELASSTDFSVASYSPNTISGFSFLLIHYLFSPSPLNTRGDAPMLLVPNMLWYFTFILSLYGVFVTWRRIKMRRLIYLDSAFYISIFLFSLINVVIYVYMPYLNEVRHRLPIVPFFIMFFSISLLRIFPLKRQCRRFPLYG